MNKNIFYILIAVIFTLLSCEDNTPEMPYNYESISSLTSDLQGEIKQKTQLRLAFGKAVANALKHNEFRDFIKNKSLENTSEYFNELVFAIHKDDKVYGNKTLENYINEAVDEEIHALYGGDFVSVVLKDDPLVSIKIPDLFYNFDWDIESYSPMVGVVTPKPIIPETNKYIVYHYSGYMNYISSEKPDTYFMILVKYSEDYILYNQVTKLNEKNISIFELIPQIEKQWSKVSKYINEIGVSHPISKNYLYFSKRLVANYYIDNCEGDYIYYGEQAVGNCDKECIRDCVEHSEEINDVFEKITIVEKYLIESATNGIFQDNIELLFFIFTPSPNDSIIDMYKTIGFRKSEFYEVKYKITKSITKEKYEKIGSVVIPRLYIKKDYIINKDVFINHRFRKGWKNDRDDYVMHNFSIVRYQDIVRQLHIPYSVKNNDILLNCSEIISVDQSPLDYCMSPQLDEYYNIVMISVKHRY